MKIQLSNGMLMKVDKKNLGLFNLYHWHHLSAPSNRHYAYTIVSPDYKGKVCIIKRVRKYVKKNGMVSIYKYKERRIPAHWLVLQLNKSEKRVVDHINGDGLDNRWSNLRLCTMKQNQGNRKINKNNTSGYRGVSLLEGMYRAELHITINGKRGKIYAGRYNTALEAAIAYDKLARQYFGEFARTNFLWPR